MIDLAELEKGHTPLPWEQEQDGLYITALMDEEQVGILGHERDILIAVLESDVELSGFGNRQANADLIVKAVNCHDELLDTLRRTLDVIKPGTGNDYLVLRIAINAAIAKV